jgi:hypothetical protein
MDDADLRYSLALEFARVLQDFEDQQQRLRAVSRFKQPERDPETAPPREQ